MHGFVYISVNVPTQATNDDHARPENGCGGKGDTNPRLGLAIKSVDDGRRLLGPVNLWIIDSLVVTGLVWMLPSKVCCWRGGVEFSAGGVGGGTGSGRWTIADAAGGGVCAVCDCGESGRYGGRLLLAYGGWNFAVGLGDSEDISRWGRLGGSGGAYLGAGRNHIRTQGGGLAS